MNDEQISLKAAINAICKAGCSSEWCGVSCDEVLALEALPSAQPEPHYDEWCTDCKEYDQERHCCPRWNRVIRQTVEEYKAAQPTISCDHENDTSSAQPDNDMIHLQKEQAYLQGWEEGREALRKEQRWIPVTLETLPYPNSVVVVCGEKGTWDYGMYRGWYDNIHSWWWKKNSIKHVYWWMYKDDAMSLPYRKEGGE